MRTTKIKGGEPQKQMLRLQDKILTLGGEIPDPWEHAIIKRVMRKGKRKVIVDLPLYNLQLLELKEDLEKKATPEQLAKAEAIV